MAEGKREGNGSWSPALAVVAEDELQDRKEMDGRREGGEEEQDWEGGVETLSNQ